MMKNGDRAVAQIECVLAVACIANRGTWFGFSPGPIKAPIPPIFARFLWERKNTNLLTGYPPQIIEEIKYAFK